MTEWTRGNLREWRNEHGELGGTMRLGAYTLAHAELPGRRISEIDVGSATHSQRHRHRYEVNIHLKERLERAGLAFQACGPTASCRRWSKSPHPWFIGAHMIPN